MRPEPDLDSRTTRFSDHRTIRLMKIMASSVLSAAIKQQYSSVVLLLHRCLPDFDEICGMVMNLVFFVRVTLIKIANTPLDRSAALVLSVLYCSCAGVWQIRLEIWPEPDLVGFPKYGRISDLPEPELKSGPIQCNPNNTVFHRFMCVIVTLRTGVMCVNFIVHVIQDGPKI